MRPPQNFSLYALLVVVASARLSMQMIAMPPYAGLDEIYHVARLAFVVEEHRSPAAAERSVPPYLEATLERRPAAVPSFAILQDQWRNAPPIRDRALTPHDLRPYVRPNHEAQQPSAYYSALAPLARIGSRTILGDLRRWRLASVIFALATVLATARIGERWFGKMGISAAALIAFLPTWETLVVRVSNDALACALAAIAIAATVYEKPIVELIAWPLAIAVKLYTWPLAIVAAILWWRQRASKWRVISVSAVAIAVAALTIVDLSSRTRNAFGVVAFDRPAAATSPRIDILEIIKVTIASAAWTSGEHWDALKPLGIAMYVLPVMVAVIVAGRKSEARLALVALIAFGAAQAMNALLWFLARAPQLGGGKEGWYWFVLAPVVMPALIAPAADRFRWLPWWVVAWDILITDCELIPTWLGLTSPLHPSILFRWGPMHVPPAWVVPFRVAEIAGLWIMVRRA